MESINSLWSTATITKRLKLIPLAFTVLLCLISCSKLSTDDILLISSGCRAPCWNNLVPGETSLDEALIILKEIESVVQESISFTPYSDKLYDDGIDFELVSTNTSGLLGFRDQKLYFITFLNLVRKGESSLGISVGEITSLMGEPTLVGRAGTFVPSLLGDKTTTIIYLINQTKGYAVSFDAGNIGRDQPFFVTSEDLISRLQYFAPSDFYQLLEEGYFRKIIDLQPWEGYKEYFPFNESVR